jgi:hypothetical protein
MARRFLGCGCWVLLSIGLFYLLAAASVRAELHFPQPTADVGVARCGAPLSHRFPFVNRGRTPVEILEVRAGCGCLTPRLPQRVYQPGESGTLLLEINTLSQEEGPHTWTCEVVCQSEGRRSDVRLQITGRIITEVTVRPAVLTLFTDGALAHELVLTDRRPQPLAVTALEATSPRLRHCIVEEKRNEQGHSVRRIRLEVSADYAEGRHEETLTIFTNDPLYRELKVPVTVIKRSQPRVTATPGEAAVAANGQPIQSFLIRLRDRQDEKVVVEQLTADDPAVACQWAPGPDTQATLKLRVDRSRLTADTAVRVRLAQPVREALVIPIKRLPE